MIKALPTRVLMAVPREFIPTYVQHGQAVCEAMYGKRATLRYVRTVGRLKLKRLRRGETAVSADHDGGKVRA